MNKRGQLALLIFAFTLGMIIAIFAFGTDFFGAGIEIGETQISIVDTYQLAEQTREYIALSAKYSIDCSTGEFNEGRFEEYLESYPTEYLSAVGSNHFVDIPKDPTHYDIYLSDGMLVGEPTNDLFRIKVSTKAEYSDIQYIANPSFKIRCS